MNKNNDKQITPGGVDEYIASCPEHVREKLRQLRSIIKSCAPGSIETVSYFQLPGYAYPGYDYNGMFVWFSFKEPFLRLHIRPPVLKDHDVELVGYKKTASILNIHVDQTIPKVLIEMLVNASLKEMRSKELS
jgi:uncharacterized protein YdhG (YjbR/CyaY superfamily)